MTDAPLSIRVVVPGTPQSWKRALPRAGGARNDPAYTAAKTDVGWRMVQAVGQHRRAFLESRLSLDVLLEFPDRRVRDADRVLNLVLDAGRSILWGDDRWTTFEGGALIVRPVLNKSAPGMVITVERIGKLEIPNDETATPRTRTPTPRRPGQRHGPAR